jgi:hypothetical protein
MDPLSNSVVSRLRHGDGQMRRVACQRADAKLMRDPRWVASQLGSGIPWCWADAGPGTVAACHPILCQGGQRLQHMPFTSLRVSITAQNLGIPVQMAWIRHSIMCRSAGSRNGGHISSRPWSKWMTTTAYGAHFDMGRHHRHRIKASQWRGISPGPSMVSGHREYCPTWE